MKRYMLVVAISLIVMSSPALSQEGSKHDLAPPENFCGSSTFGKCSDDPDCIRGGCSSQVCQSKHEEPAVTTCEWRDCYDAAKYEKECKCVNGRCQWHGRSHE